MSRVLLSLAAAISLPCMCMRADVMVSSSISAAISITPQTGSLSIISPTAASAFAQAADSLGGLDQQLNSVNDAATSASAMTTLASASASASAPLLSASSASSVDILNITASASGVGNGGPGSLIGTFEILGSGTTVSVNVSVTLTGNQSLETTGGGQLATSEVIFSLLDPVTLNPLLFYDNPLAIGPDTIMVSPLSMTLAQSETLAENTPYSLLADVDAESSGLNIVPEPSLLPLVALGLFGIAIIVLRPLN